jgi:hypothetical protein
MSQIGKKPAAEPVSYDSDDERDNSIKELREQVVFLTEQLKQKVDFDKNINDHLAQLDA